MIRPNRRYPILRILLIAVLSVPAGSSGLIASETGTPVWTEKLNRDGIIIWTRQVEGYRLDSYRAQSEFDVPIESIYAHLTDLSGFPRWIQHLEYFEVISEEEGRWVFYEVINPPIGRRRDYVGEMTGTPPGPDGVARIVQRAVDGYRPLQGNMIRIDDFHQTWTLVKLGESRTRATLEVLYDPGGNPPVNALNWMTAQGPYQTFTDMREALEGK